MAAFPKLILFKSIARTALCRVAAMAMEESDDYEDLAQLADAMADLEKVTEDSVRFALRNIFAILWRRP